MILDTYFPPRPPEHLTCASNVRRAREEFLAKRPANLEFLLRKRYEWMNEYVEGKPRVVELGAGLGLSREFIRHPGLLLTDITLYPWIDREVDAAKLPFSDGSIDAFICSHTIHHLSRPLAFFDEVRRCLKPGGRLLIQELEASYLLRLLQRVMKNEGWSTAVDVFDRGEPCIPGGDDPWTANTAIPNLLFSSPERFEREATGLKVVRNELCEFLIFPLSGGVLTKVPSLPLPRAALKLIDAFDRLMVATFPKLLALGRRVVLEKSR
ncbi:MAG: class I SAM-dependent methyltransferase [Elusimicrobia bacterium]|nr:class I SAM-dependent methyltransferase [Elusimicrobiota bacterium]